MRHDHRRPSPHHTRSRHRRRHRPLRRAVAGGRRPHRPRAGADLLRRARPRDPRDRRRPRRARGSSAATTSRSSPARARSGRSPTSARWAPGRRSSRSTRPTRPRSASTSSPTRASGRSSARTPTQVAKVEQVRERCPELEHVIVFDGDAPGAVTLAELRARGAATGDAVVAERLAHVSPRDVATIVYTSGTTGPPKGCVVTHANLLATVAMYVRELELRGQPHGDLPVPAAGALARARRAVRGARGRRHAGVLGRRPDADHRRSWPRCARRTSRRCRASTRRSTRRCSTASPSRAAVKRALFDWALREGAQARAAAREGSAARPRGAASRHRLADRLVLSKVRGVFGDRLAMALCGAAPIAREVLEFFDACGVLVLEGYGMTETCAAATLNTPRAVRFGTVGRPLAGRGGGDRRGRRDPDGRPARVRRLPPRPRRDART